MVPGERATVCGMTCRVLRLLGRGKGGYSWLAEADGRQVVLKQIHHEPCDYYAFGDKIEAERRDYRRLRDAGIRMPQMLAIDAREMAAQARAAGLNIDWFPTNFVARDGLIWYVDYECNEFMDAWSFENWGVKYWSRTPEFEAYLARHGD